jgi:acyl carrier protein
MSIFTQVQDIITEVLEIEPEEITMESYVMRDLPTESIDLMEYGVGFASKCGVSIHDDIIFLQSLRMHIAEAEEKGLDTIEHISGIYPHLSSERLSAMFDTIEDGPVLQVRDIVAYIQHANSML